MSGVATQMAYTGADDLHPACIALLTIERKSPVFEVKCRKITRSEVPVGMTAAAGDAVDGGDPSSKDLVAGTGGGDGAGSIDGQAIPSKDMASSGYRFIDGDHAVICGGQATASAGADAIEAGVNTAAEAMAEREEDGGLPRDAALSGATICA